MELFIQIRDGQPSQHPIFGDNFREAFPHIDVNNLPPEFARFERVERPRLAVYEVLESQEPTYELIEGVYKDVWRKRNMTLAEKTAKQDEIKLSWSLNGFASWAFDEESCQFIPPTPYPQDGSIYEWDEPTTSWKVKT
jgi:hypothetical protein